MKKKNPPSPSRGVSNWQALQNQLENHEERSGHTVAVIRESHQKRSAQQLTSLSEAIRRVIGDGLRSKAVDPAMVKVTITEVRVAPDMHNASVFFATGLMASSDGIAEDEKKSAQQKILQSLQQMAPYLQRTIAAHVRLRRTPKLSFFLDDRFDEVAHVEQLLRSVRTQS